MAVMSEPVPATDKTAGLGGRRDRGRAHFRRTRGRHFRELGRLRVVPRRRRRDPARGGQRPAPIVAVDLAHRRRPARGRARDCRSDRLGRSLLTSHPKPAATLTLPRRRHQRRGRLPRHPARYRRRPRHRSCRRRIRTTSTFSPSTTGESLSPIPTPPSTTARWCARTSVWA